MSEEKRKHKQVEQELEADMDELETSVEESTKVESTELEKAQALAEEYKTQYLRALADYRNYERRVNEQNEQVKSRIKADVINKLLPFLDNLEKAEVFIKDIGLKMIKDQFVQTMEQLGLKEIELEGKEFDPHVAEAVEVVEGKKDNLIVKVSRKAYKLNDQVIQHGLVTVSKKA